MLQAVRLQRRELTSLRRSMEQKLYMMHHTFQMKRLRGYFNMRKEPLSLHIPTVALFFVATPSDTFKMLTQKRFLQGVE